MDEGLVKIEDLYCIIGTEDGEEAICGIKTKDGAMQCASSQLIHIHKIRDFFKVTFPEHKFKIVKFSKPEVIEEF